MDAGPARLRLAAEVGADGEERRDRVVDLDHRQARSSTGGRVEVRPTIAAEAGDARSILA